MSVLVLILPETPEAAQAEWALVDGGAVIAGGVIAPGDHPELPEGAKPERAIALAPAETLFLRRAPVPGDNDRDARRAAPFLIEEYLAQPLDAVRVEIGPLEEAGDRLIGAVDGSLLEAWRRFAGGLGVKPVHLAPDALLLPSHGADLVAFAYDDRILVRLGRADLGETTPGRDVEVALGEPLMFATEAKLAQSLLPALTETLQPRRVLVSAGMDPELTAPEGAPIALKRVEAPDLRVLAANTPLETVERLPGLLGAGFASVLDWAGLLAPWRVAAVLALVAVAASTLLAVIEAAYLERRATAYAQAELETFQTAFPETRPTNIQAQLRQALAAVGAVEDRAGFLELSAALADIMAGSDAVRIDALRYDGGRGVLSVSALYRDFDDFEALQLAAEARGVVLDDGGARQSASGVAAEFTVRLP